MSKEMREFLTAWLSWATSPNPEEHEYGSIFRTTTGLCAATDYWTGSNPKAYCMLVMELGGMLEEDCLCAEYPFDTEESYTEAATKHTQHLNPARLAWVRSKLESKDE